MPGYCEAQDSPHLRLAQAARSRDLLERSLLTDRNTSSNAVSIDGMETDEGIMLSMASQSQTTWVSD